VYSLRDRGLVETPRREGIWTAALTVAGRFYLEHGHHPDDPQHLPAGAVPGKPGGREARDPRPGRPGDLAADLIREIQEAGGTLRVAEPGDETRGRYRRAVHAAKQRGAVPEGFHLLHTGRDMGDLVMRLERDDQRDQTDWNRIRLSARDLITDPDALAVRLREDRHSVDVSDQLLERALETVRLLVGEAGRRGCQVAVSRRGKPRGLQLHAGGLQFGLSIREECDTVPRTYTPEELRERKLYPWRRIQPETSQVPPGRLRVELRSHAEVRHWSDDTRSPVERKARSIIDEAGRLAEAADRAQEERERAFAVLRHRARHRAGFLRRTGSASR
jgi:hypothetical protein